MIKGTLIKMNTDFVNVKGWVTLRSYCFTDKDKSYLQKIKEKTQNNLVTNNGKIFFANKIINELENVSISKIAIGSGNILPTVTDTSLDNQFFEKPIINSIIESNNIIKFQTAILTNEGAGSVNELGLFTSNNNMVCKIVLTTPFVKIIDEILTIEWFLQIGDSI